MKEPLKPAVRTEQEARAVISMRSRCADRVMEFGHEPKHPFDIAAAILSIPLWDDGGEETRTRTPYLIWSNEHQAWWRAKSSGYTTHVDAAGHYSWSEAIEICANARNGWTDAGVPSEIPVARANVLACALARMPRDPKMGAK